VSEEFALPDIIIPVTHHGDGNTNSGRGLEKNPDDATKEKP
jgi:hypothetical protein